MSDYVSRPQIQLFEDDGGQFRFRVRAPNHEILCTSEGYTTKAHAARGAEALVATMLLWLGTQVRGKFISEIDVPIANTMTQDQVAPEADAS